MKKLTLSALSIAVVCFAACTKDNSKSVQPSTPSVKINSVSSSSLSLRDTIHPSSAIKVKTAAAPIDTIHP